MILPLGFAENSIQLVPDGTLILHVLIILGMIFLLNATLYKPINAILEARDKRTRGRLSEAQEILKNVSDKVTEYEHALRDARREAYAFTEGERSGAMQQRQQQLNEMRQQLAESVAKEKSAIQQQADEARGTLDQDSRRIAREIGARVLSRPLSDVEMN